MPAGQLGVLPCRPPAAGCADQRSAFPCLRVALHGGVGPRPAPLAGGQRNPRIATHADGTRQRSAGLRPASRPEGVRNPHILSPLMTPPTRERRQVSRWGPPDRQCWPQARERRPPVGTRGSAKPAPMTPGPANVGAAPPFHAGGLNGPTRSCGFLPVGVSGRHRAPKGAKTLIASPSWRGRLNLAQVPYLAEQRVQSRQ